MEGSDYRYFLFAIYDIRFTQLTEVNEFNHGWILINTDFFDTNLREFSLPDFRFPLFEEIPSDSRF